MQIEPKQNIPQKIEKGESKDCCQGGYGYMKRRLGLLSYEIDKIIEEKQKHSKK